VIDMRRRTTNSTPQKINEVFLSLARHEFGIDGEFCFLKIPFLHLVGELKIGRYEAEKALNALSVPGLWEELSPFFKVLAQKAYDLVLIARMPQVAETTDELIEGVKRHVKNLTMRQWFQVLVNLPGAFYLRIIILFIGFGFVTVFFGIGKALIDKEMFVNRVRPDIIIVKNVVKDKSHLPYFANIIASNYFKNSANNKKYFANISIECLEFKSPTPAFVVEVSHPDAIIINAFAFIQEFEFGERAFTVVPVQRDSGRFRLMLPKQETGNQLIIILNFEVDQDEDVAGVARRLVLRSLQ